MNVEETIAAVATAYGEGGIGIIRISGSKSKSILKTLFVALGDKPIQNRVLSYGHIIDPKTKIIADEVLSVFMAAPATYTREDLVEIHCHGSMVSLGKILSLVLSHGARLAEPGEFTKRAFLNGRLDLSQAEAVIDLIKAKTEKGFQSALGQLSGLLSEKIREIRAKLMDVLVQITVNLDYPDEDIEEITYESLEYSILEINDNIAILTDSVTTGRIIRDGLSVVIAGSPNVGKSSLMNGLMQENRAIVTEIPGTTRDTIEEFINIRGIPIRLIDTAGIRETEDVIEKIGIEKSKEAFQKADLILLVMDSSTALTQEQNVLLKAASSKPVIVLMNKSDLVQQMKKEDIDELLPGCQVIHTAVTEGKGLDELSQAIEHMVYSGKSKQNESLLVTNARHADLLLRARESLEDALCMIKRKEALDFIEVDVRQSWSLLGEMIGETATEDIITEVFANFCLGK